MTNKEMKEWVKTTWNKCQEDAWAMPTTPQPEQKPVAWMHKFIRDNIITHTPADIGRWTPLYAAPQPRKVDNGLA